MIPSLELMIAALLAGGITFWLAERKRVKEVNRLQQQSITKTKKCVACDADIQYDFKYCPHCGAGPQ